MPTPGLQSLSTVLLLLLMLCSRWTRCSLVTWLWRWRTVRWRPMTTRSRLISPSHRMWRQMSSVSNRSANNQNVCLCITDCCSFCHRHLLWSPSDRCIIPHTQLLSLPPPGRIWDVMLVSRKTNINRTVSVLCTTEVLHTTEMMHSGTSSSYRPFA